MRRAIIHHKGPHRGKTKKHRLEETTAFCCRPIVGDTDSSSSLARRCLHQSHFVLGWPSRTHTALSACAVLTGVRVECPDPLLDTTKRFKSRGELINSSSQPSVCATTRSFLLMTFPSPPPRVTASRDPVAGACIIGITVIVTLT